MFSVKVPAEQLKQMSDAIKGLKTTVQKETATAINKTSKKTVSFVSKTVREVATVKSAIFKKTIQQKKTATQTSRFAKIALWDGYKIPLEYYTARAGKKGVSYKYRKTGSYVIHPTAFHVAKWGGFYERISKARGPIRTVFGLSPGDFFKETQAVQKAKAFAQKELPKQMKERVRYLLLKQQGKLKGKQQ